jgi:hypothetical protein
VRAAFASLPPSWRARAQQEAGVGRRLGETTDPDDENCIGSLEGGVSVASLIEPSAKCVWLKPRLTSEPCACQPLLTPIVKELFNIEFSFPIWPLPPIRIGGSVSFTASFGESLGGRACIADRKVERVLTPEATLSVRAQLRRMPTSVRCV